MSKQAFLSLLQAARIKRPLCTRQETAIRRLENHDSWVSVYKYKMQLLANVVGLKCQNSETDIYQPQQQKNVVNGRMGRTRGKEEAESEKQRPISTARVGGYGRRNDWNMRTR